MIRTRDDAGLRLITLARPDKANALTEAMLNDLTRAVEQAPGSAIVLTGEGKVFSAGADLDAVAGGLATSAAWEQLSGAIAGFDGLTVAALNGTVAGGAMGMVLACDLRLAAPGARFFYPVMKMGVRPQPSDPGRLSALVGPSRAKLMLLAGAKISAEEALGWGLLDRIVDDPVACARELAQPCLAAPSGLSAAIKGMIP